MLRKTLAFYFPTVLVCYPFEFSPLAMNCQLPGMHPCFSASVNWHLQTPFLQPPPLPFCGSSQALLRTLMWGLLDYCRALAHRSVLNSWPPVCGCFAHVLFTSVQIGKPQPVEGVDSKSSHTPRRLYTCRRQCPERRSEITKKKRDLEKEKKIAEAMCLFLECSYSVLHSE